MFRRPSDLFIFICGFFLAGLPLAHAGLGTSLMQTATLRPPGEFEAKVQSDIIFNRGGGFDISTHLVTGIVAHYVDIDAFVGTGTTHFQVGALGKYNLLPDLPDQVALSFLGGFSYLKDSNFDSALVSTGILASKKMAVSFGDVTPYAALELEFHFVNGDAFVPVTALVGAKWEPQSVVPWGFYSEFSFGIHESVYMLALGASYPF